MKKTFALLCATTILSLGILSCSDGGDAKEPIDNSTSYTFEQGIVSAETRSKAEEMPVTSFAEIKAIRDYLKNNTTSYDSKSVSEKEISELFIAGGLSSSQVSSEIDKLKSRGNYITFYPAQTGAAWFYAEKPGANSSASDTTKTDTKTPSETTQTSDTTNTTQPQTPSETLEDLFKKKAVKQTLLSVPKELDYKDWAIDCDIPSSKLNGIKEGSILELSVNKQVLADYSQIRICPTGSWVSLDMKEFYAFANSAQLEDAMVATDGKNITLKSDSAIIYVKLSASDCTKLKNNGLTIHGHCVKIYSVKVGI